MNYTKPLLSLLLLVAVHGNTVAVPAYPWKMKVKQPDGSTLTIRKTGDEHAAITMTADGYPLIFNAADNSYEYARIDGTQLVPTGILAADEKRRQPEVCTMLQTVDRSAVDTILATARRQRNALPTQRRTHTPHPRKVLISDIPTTGKQKSLVILVEFIDRQFSMTDPHDFYHDMLNEEGYTNRYGATGSARDFYLTSSCGQYDPDFVVVGPVRLERSYSYYGANMTPTSGIDYQIYEFVHDAAAAADSLVDYSQFDSDNDGKVDNIYFFYAGYGEADSGSNSTIWPHSANYFDDFEETLICDGMYINRYACSQELSGQQHVPVGIGTFVHEYGHVLGLVDHYNTQSQQAGGPGLWDTMANGSYLNNQHTPPLFSAFERAELGWMQYTALDSSADSIVTMAPLADENMGYCVKVSDNEYFVIETRQQKGWDKYLPGHGLLVWHIDMDEQLWWQNKANADPNHQRIDLVEADRTPEHDGGDAFPGTKSVTQFAFESWAGDDVFGFETIDEIGENVRFLLSGTAYQLPAPDQVLVSSLMGRSAVVEWTPVPDASSYTVTVSSVGVHGNTVAVPATVPATVNSLAIDHLEPLTAYTVSVVAHMAGYASAPAELNFTTTDLHFVEKQVSVKPAADVTSSSFVAQWDELADADAYLVSLFRNEMTGRAEDKWDFTGQSASRPEGWSTTGSRYDNNYYGESAPSLRLSKDGDYLEMKHEGSKLSRLSFWFRASNEGNRLLIEQLKDGEWTTVELIDVAAANATTVAVELDAADAVRIVFEKHANYVQIDDVTCEYMVEQLTAVNTVDTGDETSCLFKGLTPGDYSYCVVAVSGTEQTLPSEFVRVTVADQQGIVEVPTSPKPAKRPAYDLNGRHLGTSFHGIVVIGGRKLWR